MRITIIFIFLLALFSLIGCDNIEVIDNNLSYEEILVLRGELVANEFFRGVTLMRSLPLDQIYSESEAEIKDAVVVLTVDGDEEIQLNYLEKGKYNSGSPLLVQPGRIYEISVKWKEKQLYAITKVPLLPQSQNAAISGDFIRGEIITRAGEVYGATWILADSPESIRAEAEDFYEIIKGNPEAGSRITIRTANLPQAMTSPQYHDLLYIRYYAFDKDYLDYYLTREFQNPTGNGFLQGGGPIIWNVEGDGIGLFIGLAKTNPVKAR